MRLRKLNDLLSEGLEKLERVLLLQTYSFAWWSWRSLGSWGPDEGSVVDGAALVALGLNGGSVLGDLGCDYPSAELQDLFITQTRTLQNRNRKVYLLYIKTTKHHKFHPVNYFYSYMIFLGHFKTVGTESAHVALKFAVMQIISLMNTVTHKRSLDSFGSCPAFNTSVTDWATLSSAPWDPGWADRPGDAITTNCPFWATL